MVAAGVLQSEKLWRLVLDSPNSPSPSKRKLWRLVLDWPNPHLLLKQWVRRGDRHCENTTLSTRATRMREVNAVYPFRVYEESFPLPWAVIDALVFFIYKLGWKAMTISIYLRLATASLNIGWLLLVFNVAQNTKKDSGNVQENSICGIKYLTSSQVPVNT